MAKSAERRRDWSELPVEVLELIVRCLSLLDHLHFGWVCRSWRRARSAPRLTHLPWLNLPSWTYKRRLVDPFYNKSHNLCGCASYTVASAPTALGVTGSWPVAHSATVSPGIRWLCPVHTLKSESRSWVTMSACALSNPGAADFAAIVALYPETELAYFCRGHKKWSVHCYEYLNAGWIKQVVANVHGKFYGLTDEGRLVRIDFLDGDMTVFLVNCEIVDYNYGEHAYLVESDGELLVVVMACPHHHCTPAFRMLRLDVATSTWVEGAEGVLGDRLLFLAERKSLSVSGAAGLGVPGGRIYTAGEESFGVFDLSMGTGSVCCFHPDPASPWLQSIWLTPSFYRKNNKSFRFLKSLFP